MGKRSREKGACFERAVAIVMRGLYPSARRGIGQARSGGEVPDVDGTPWWVEAKHRRRVSVMAAWRQATDARDERPALVVTREDRGPTLVTMAIEDFVRLVGGDGYSA